MPFSFSFFFYKRKEFCPAMHILKAFVFNKSVLTYIRKKVLRLLVGC